MLALRLILNDKGGKQHYLPFGGWDIFEIEDRGILYILHWGFQKSLCKACLLFNCFLVIKGTLKALFSFIPWLLNFSDLPNYGSNSRKRYTLRLSSKCLVRSTLLPIRDKAPLLKFNGLNFSKKTHSFS